MVFALNQRHVDLLEPVDYRDCSCLVQIYVNEIIGQKHNQPIGTVFLESGPVPELLAPQMGATLKTRH